MHRDMLLVLALTVSFCTTAGAQECPTYTKNRDTLEAFSLGDPVELFEGFVVFRIEGQYGLHRSPLRAYDPQIVAGTETAVPYNMTLSDDGDWVMYFDSESQEVVIQRLDGTGRTSSWMWGVRTGGFYRNSPHGSEIYYLESSARVTAVQVDLSGAQAEILGETQRTIVDLGWERRLDGAYSNSGSSVVGDQVFLREDATNEFGYVGRTAFITIPDSGRGTASLEHVHPWADTVFEPLWGCGHAMSHDGVYCMANSSLIGSSCVPNRLNDPMMDHKGFYVTRFWRDTDPAIPIHDIADTYGISINWAPPSYRHGEFSDVDFTGWQFTNHPRFVAGQLGGVRLEEFGLENGLWIVDWISNTWTRITPDSLRLAVQDPAVYFSDPAGVAQPFAASGSAQPRAVSPRRVVFHDGNVRHGAGQMRDVYTLDGRRAAARWTEQHYRSCAGVYIAIPAAQER